MAKFTAGVDLNLRVFPGYEISGAAGATHRIPDAYADEFYRDFGASMPGFAWVVQDEGTSFLLPIAQTDVTGLTASLASKYDKTGGTISGAVTVTGALIAQASATVAGSLAVQNNLNVTNTVTGADLSVSGTAIVSGAATAASTLRVGGALTQIGAANLSSTLGVTGKVTLGNVVAMGGTAFPGSPSDNDLYYRTDLDLLFFRDSGSSKWLSTNLYHVTIPSWAQTSAGLSATTAAALRTHVPLPSGGSDIYLVDQIVDFFVNGGTALSGSHKWVGTLDKVDSGNSTFTIVTDNISSGSSSVWRQQVDSINAVLHGGQGPYFVLQSSWTKTGTPGNLLLFVGYSYRIVAT